jgi:hypothetical protein
MVLTRTGVEPQVASLQSLLQDRLQGKAYCIPANCVVQ